MIGNDSGWQTIEVEQLRTGLFVNLPLSWADHPFIFNKLKIKSQKQIDDIKSLGISHLLYLPEKSDCEPGTSEGIIPTLDIAIEEPIRADAIRAKKDRIEKNRIRKNKMQQCARSYSMAVSSVRSLTKLVHADPFQASYAAKQLVEHVTKSLLDGKDFALHLMRENESDDNTYFHLINTSMLTMLLARESGLSQREIENAGLAALLHDTGKTKIPPSILLQERRTRAEESLYRMHVRYSLDVISKIHGIPREVITSVAQHHERIDGSGYPKGLSGNRISQIGKILAIADEYDELCANKNRSITPQEALSELFTHHAGKLDKRLLNQFIHSLGVFPPGTIVELSNGMIGMVVSVNSQNLLNPSLLMYDPEIPKDEAIIIDLSEDPDTAIEASIRPEKLPDDIYEYLNPTLRVAFYAEGVG